MIPTVIWTKKETVYKEPKYMITKLTGYVTIGCQCYGDCSCSDKISDIIKFRVSGKNRKDFIPKPFDFDSIEDAKNRIKSLSY